MDPIAMSGRTARIPMQASGCVRFALLGPGDYRIPLGKVPEKVGWGSQANALFHLIFTQVAHGPAVLVPAHVAGTGSRQKEYECESEAPRGPVIVVKCKAVECILGMPRV
jgi:hypothetical protein